MIEVLAEYLARGFLVMLTISMPCVLVAAGVGLVIGILQAVTQVQEQTIAAAPKILAVFLVIVIGGFGFIRILTNFFTDGMNLAFQVLPKMIIMFYPLIITDILLLTEILRRINSEISKI